MLPRDVNFAVILRIGTGEFAAQFATTLSITTAGYYSFQLDFRDGVRLKLARKLRPLNCWTYLMDLAHLKLKKVSADSKIDPKHLLVIYECFFHSIYFRFEPSTFKMVKQFS